jgi:hypothetical protein
MNKQIKQWETTYTSKWNGAKETHINTNNVSDASGWTRSLAEENGCKAECHEVYTDGSRKHVVSYGDNNHD